MVYNVKIIMNRFAVSVVQKREYQFKGREVYS